MQQTEAITAATKFAQDRGYDPQQYDVTANKQKLLWKLDFHMKTKTKPRPGDFFTIFVDDRSGAFLRIVYGK